MEDGTYAHYFTNTVKESKGASIKFLHIFIALSLLPQLWIIKVNSSDHALFQTAYDPSQFFSSSKVFKSKSTLRGTCNSSSSPNENSGTSI